MKLERVVASMMEDLRITYPVNVYQRSNTKWASANRVKDGEESSIHITSEAGLKKLMPYLSKSERDAKTIAQVAEEVCHLAKHERCHPAKVTKCTIRMMKHYMTKRQFESDVIQKKMRAADPRETTCLSD